MGHLHKRVRVSGDKAVTVRMFVDTGATYSMLPAALARTIGMTAMCPVRMTLADGRRVKANAGIAVFKIGDREAPATVLVGDVVDSILGVETLEALGLAVDLRRGRLIPTRSWTVRLSGAFAPLPAPAQG